MDIFYVVNINTLCQCQNTFSMHGFVINTVNQLYLAAIKFGVWFKVDLFGAF